MTNLNNEEEDDLFYFSPRNWFFIILALMICAFIYSQNKKANIMNPVPAVQSLFK